VNRPDLPTLWVDTMEMLSRSEPQVVLMRFFSIVPEALVEVARIQTPLVHVRRMIDVLCKSLNYYPTGEPEAGKSAGEKS
jgi:hypothetical protein